MQTMQLAQPQSVAHEKVARRKTSVVPDPGPWLVLAAPISLALTLLTLIYLARISF